MPISCSIRNKGPGPVDRYLDEHYYWTEMMGRLRPGVAHGAGAGGLGVSI